MKKSLVLAICICAVLQVSAQWKERLSFATTAGTGIALSRPSFTPFTWQVVGYYSLGKQFSMGAGTGVSVYEKTLLPLFAAVKFTLLKERKFSPYAECNAGYAFAPDKNTNGGFCLSPAVGVQYALRGNKKIVIAVGYEYQKLQRLKSYENQLFRAEFTEELRHSSLSLKAGFLF